MPPYTPVLPVAIPLLTAVLLAILSKVMPRPVPAMIAIAGAALTTVFSVLLLFQAQSDIIVYWFGGWHPRGNLALGISFAIDPIGAGLASFAAFLGTAALIFSYKYFDEAGNHFPALILAFLAAMSGFVLTGDAFNLFVFFELMSAAAFALCAYKTDDPGSVQGAVNFAVTNTIGAYFVLTGVGLLYARTDALNMAQMGNALAGRTPDALVLCAFAFVTCGYLIKAAVVPFHFWLADAHAVAPTPVCILFSGVMVEMGLYGVTRMYWAVFDRALHPHLANLRVLFITIGVATAIIGAVMCYSQRNLKRLLAFSTISHMGVMTTGVGLFTPTGLAGVFVYALGHGAIKSALFLTAGIFLHRFQRISELDLRGKGKHARAASIVFLAGAAGLAGLPLSGVDLGDKLTRVSAETIGYGWTHSISLFAAAVTSAAVFRAGGRILFAWGPSKKDAQNQSGQDHDQDEEKPETKEGHHRTPFSMIFPPVLLVILGLFLALVPGLSHAALNAATQFENTAGYDARVLQGTPIPVPHATTPPLPDSALAFIGICAALIIALLHLFSKPVRDVSVIVTRPLKPIQMLHSGHVGDYVAFVAFGIAVFGAVCEFLL